MHGLPSREIASTSSSVNGPVKWMTINH